MLFTVRKKRMGQPEDALPEPQEDLYKSRLDHSTPSYAAAPPTTDAPPASKPTEEESSEEESSEEESSDEE